MEFIIILIVIALFVVFFDKNSSKPSNKKPNNELKSSLPEKPKAINQVTKKPINRNITEKKKKKTYDDIEKVFDYKSSYTQIPFSSQEKNKKSHADCIRSLLVKKGVSSVWHVTHKNNIKDILNRGILSNKEAYSLAKPLDISNSSVQKRRDFKDPIYGRQLHDYAPTYIKIKNPMLYVLKDMWKELCLIEISLSVLSENNFIFTDGNAATGHTSFYNMPDDLKKLPWDVLNATYWNDFHNGKRKRCSEILIYPLIEKRHIIKLHCCSIDTLHYLSQFSVQSQISKDLFFGKFYSSMLYNDDIKI